MPKPIQFETVLTRQRLVEELQQLEAEAAEITHQTALSIRLRELRIAVETKPMDIDPQ